MLTTVLALALSGPAFLDNIFETVSPPSSPAGGVDMSSYFKTLKTCSECTAAGYGWCPVRRMCGGFANKECGIGQNYVAEGHVAATSTHKKKASPSSPPKKKTAPQPQKAQRRATPSAGQDMSQVFAKLRDCSSCIAAGYGWCPLQRKCGGFANQECGIGERYFAAGPPSRNGIWESKTAKAQKAQAEAAPVAEVPKASPPPPASLLYAGPASPPPTEAATISPDGTASTVSARLSSFSNNTAPLEEEELMLLPRDALVAKILQLQATVDSMRIA